jgi:type II secretory ATPase GspE/PulE/Tfp pilus assembly ATPase PilB-like protein
LEDLNMDPETLRSWGRDLQRSRGLLLVTGPPDSGKTTTIYASLRRMVNEQRNLTTIEPHVYETIDLVNQIQLNPKAGLVFSSALRNAALQDCDAIFISELHGSDVAQLALEVAHRNCLVLAIVHDEYAAGAVGHLLRMYAEPALVSGALKGVLAQHLLVRLCPSCKRPAAPDEELLQRLSLQPSTILMEAPGCQACQGSGRASGRLAVFEYLPMTPQLSQQILSQRDRFEAQPSSLPTRILELLQAGEIGLEEALPHLSYPR